MSKATFWQRGETLDFKNTTTSIIEENTIIPINTRIGITGTFILPGETGSLHVAGIFEIKKAEGEIKLGNMLYFDGTVITTIAENNTPAGYAAADAALADTVVLVKLMG